MSSWVVCDTGSTDGTQAIVRGALSHLPGELVEHRWRDFAHNRTLLMQAARGRADYLLVLDADFTVTFDRDAPAGLEADSYLLPVREAGTEFRSKRLLRGDRQWRWRGAVHEYVEALEPEREALLDSIVLHHHHDGGSNAGRHERDLAILDEAVRRDPADARSVFYLAQTHGDLGDLEEAIRWYSRRVELGGWEEEVFFSRYRVGALLSRLGRWEAAVPALVAAWESRPARLEPVLELASGYRRRGEHHTAHRYSSLWRGAAKPADLLFVADWVYEWGLLFEYSVTAWWTGERSEALAACDALLAIEGLPPDFRAQTLRNREFCVAGSS